MSEFLTAAAGWCTANLEGGATAVVPIVIEQEAPAPTPAPVRPRTPAPVPPTKPYPNPVFLMASVANPGLLPLAFSDPTNVV